MGHPWLGAERPGGRDLYEIFPFRLDASPRALVYGNDGDYRHIHEDAVVRELNPRQQLPWLPCMKVPSKS